MMESINDMLFTYFPCCFCWTFGYLCCLPTLGLSFCGPAICVNDAEENLRHMIWTMNKKKLTTIGLNLSLHKQCSTSWLQIEIINIDSAAKSEL